MDESWEEGQGPKSPTEPNPLDNVIRAVRNKKPPAQFDYTLHSMEDGSQVSTVDRVCKGKSIVLWRLLNLRALLSSWSYPVHALFML
jgi:hypothetical protein